MERHLLAYYIGIAIVFASHMYMIYAPDAPIATMQQHSYINILAALLIAYYFMYKENYTTY